jgi:hypothetical protein
MSEVEAVALAVALGMCLGFSINRQMVLQRLAAAKHRGGDFFTRLTQAALSATLLVVASIAAWAMNAVSFESFMLVTLTVTLGLLLTGPALRSRLSRR